MRVRVYEPGSSFPAPLAQPEIYVVGYGETRPGYGYDIVAFKALSDGTFIWRPPAQSEEGPFVGVYDHLTLDDLPVDASVHINGDLYVTGTTQTFDAGTDIITLRFRGETIAGSPPLYGGDVTAAARYYAYTTGDDAPRDLELAQSGEVLRGDQSEYTDTTPEIFVVGSTDNGGKRGEDWLVLGYDSDLYSAANPFGPIWLQFYYNGTDPDDPMSDPVVSGGRDVAVSASFGHKTNRLYVTGFSDGDGTGADIVTIAYHPATGQPGWMGGGPAGGVVRFDGANGPDLGAKVVADGEAVSQRAFIYVTGRSLQSRGDYNVATIAYRSGWAGNAGQQAWHNDYNRADIDMDDIPYDMFLRGTGVYIAASSDNGTGKDMRTLRLDAATGGNNDPFWEISYPQIADVQHHVPMALTFIDNPLEPDYPFVVTVGRSTAGVSPQLLRTVQYEQCPGSCP